MRLPRVVCKRRPSRTQVRQRQAYHFQRIAPAHFSPILIAKTGARPQSYTIGHSAYTASDNPLPAISQHAWLSATATHTRQLQADLAANFPTDSGDTAP